jgi:hypothetical protein
LSETIVGIVVEETDSSVVIPILFGIVSSFVQKLVVIFRVFRGSRGIALVRPHARISDQNTLEFEVIVIYCVRIIVLFNNLLGKVGNVHASEPMAS